MRSHHSPKPEQLPPRGRFASRIPQRNRKSHQRPIGPPSTDAIDQTVNRLIEISGHPRAAIGLVPEVNQPAFAIPHDQQFGDLAHVFVVGLYHLASLDFLAVARVADPGSVLGTAASLGAVVADLEPDDADHRVVGDRRAVPGSLPRAFPQRRSRSLASVQFRREGWRVRWRRLRATDAATSPRKRRPRAGQ